MSDAVNHPAHYQGAYGVECMDAISNMIDREPSVKPSVAYWWASALKYLWRAPYKGGEQDLQKAVQCIGYMNSLMDGGES